LGNTPAAELQNQARYQLTRFLWSRRQSPPHGLEIQDVDIRTAVDTALCMLYTDFAQLRWKPSARVHIPAPREPNTDTKVKSKVGGTHDFKTRDTYVLIFC
jgi:hypothetical protein